MDTENIVWLVLLIAFVVVEAVTVNMVSVWFALGALAALLCSFFDLDLPIQIVAFLVVSAVTLIATRPLSKRLLAKKQVKTNFDRIIGCVGVVSEKIDNLAGQGYVYVDGKEWMARTDDDDKIIEKDEKVRILRIEGAKVFVERIKED